MADAPAPLPPIPAGNIPARLAGFQIISEIGQGGMGVVFLATWVERTPPRPVALKVFVPAVAADAALVARLRQEARAASVLKHENIVQGIDFGEAGGYPYFAMEYVRGRTLQEILQSEGPLPERRVLEIAEQMALALQHARKHGIVHRDIKPSNILITAGGVAKLADFGLAREYVRAGAPIEDPGAAPAGMTFGTPWYMSPEHAKGEDVDYRSDMYSLGATLYRVLTGSPTCDATTVQEILRACVEDPPPDPRRIRPEVTEPTARLLMRMMEKDRVRRLQTPEKLLVWIRHILEPPPPPEEPLPDEASRPRPGVYGPRKPLGRILKNLSRKPSRPRGGRAGLPDWRREGRAPPS